MFRVLSVFGTRPEAIKMAPVVRALERDARFLSLVCVSGQHRQMLDQVLKVFGIVPDIDLDLMTPDQDLTDLTARALISLRDVIVETRPDMILVHGDTTTTLAATLAGYYAKVPVAHVEAGLRTGDPSSPYPEEMNRKVAGAVATLHFAPSETARRNLLAENICSKSIEVTGNTIVDALQEIVCRINSSRSLADSLDAEIPLHPHRRLLLVTSHRRENFGSGLRSLCDALTLIAARDDVEIIYPVHLNPSVRDPVVSALLEVPNIRLLPPLEYLPFVNLLRRASIIITDSGGIQEEALSLGKPVLIIRETTERPEGLVAGTAKLVGTSVSMIVSEVSRLLNEGSATPGSSPAVSPYGDGHAAKRIVASLAYHLGGAQERSAAIA